MVKGFNSPQGNVPYPDEAEAQKVLIDAKSEFLKTYSSRLADRKTGLTYSAIVSSKKVDTIQEEKYAPSQEEIERFKQINPHLHFDGRVFVEHNPLSVTMTNETNTQVELPTPESLFKQ
jgi:hypothetical protein